MGRQQHNHRAKDRERDEDDLSKVTDDSSLDEDDDEFNEEEILSGLIEQLEALRDDKTEILNLNQELQKRCVTILHKEKSMQLQNTTKTTTTATGK